MLDLTPGLRLYASARLDTVEDYQRAVPLRTYEDFWERYWREAFPRLQGTTWPDPVPYLAVSSGTSSGKTKYIPVSRQMVRSNTRAALDVLVHHVANKPDTRVFGGKSFMLGGTVDLKEEASGIQSGDLTGIAANEIPAWARRLRFPPAELSREEDWERKMEVLGRASLQEDIRNISGTASWLLLFFEKLVEMDPGPRRLNRFYPNLELVVHGGVAFGPYRERFERWLDGSRAELREVYPASEGFFAVADRGTGEGMRLNLDGGLFYEFVPVEDLNADTRRRHWIADAEVGRDYALVVTTCAGLWSYIVGDTVRLVDRDPPRVLVSGRISYYLSAFGEHLTGEEIEDAVNTATAALGEALTDFSVGAVLNHEEDAKGRHVYVVEFAEPQPLTSERLARFTSVLDKRLCERNDDYGVHRAADYGMLPPEVRIVEPGTFAEWMRARGKLGGQNKVPRVVNDPDLFAHLRNFAGPRTLKTDT